MIKGYAMLEDTKNYITKKLVKKVSINELYGLSSIGCGTYLGFPSREIDLQYKEAIELAVTKGINLIDTAINYRGMRSEVLVGEILKELICENKIKRSEIIIATKGGYLPPDYRNSVVQEDYVDNIKEHREKFFREKISSKINYDENKIQNILNIGNSIEKEIIELLFCESRKNLNVETIDIYYLHNPEVSKAVMGDENFYKELKRTFLFLENKVKEGKLKYYGIATYPGFIVDKNKKEYLSLERISEIAKEVGGEENHFKFIQLPFNKGMDDASKIKNQIVKGKRVTPLEAAYKLKIKVMTNVSLGKGKYFDKYSCDDMIKYLADNDKVCSSMIGMKRVSNVEKNLESIL